jgi:hypothetical protein
VRVHNLLTDESKIYTCDPLDAVIAAYAQEHNDWNTWEYFIRYNHLVEVGQRVLFCGDWYTTYSGLRKDVEARLGIVREKATQEDN